MSLIIKLLDVKTEEFYIFMTPPVKKFNVLETTVFNEKLAPNALIYVNFPNLGI